MDVDREDAGNLIATRMRLGDAVGRVTELLAKLDADITAGNASVTLLGVPCLPMVRVAMV